MNEANQEIVKADPDPARAFFAVSLAADTLQSARTRLLRNDYVGALDEAKNSMRLTSSALLFRDGYVATTFDSAASYLLSHYPGAVPVEEWRYFETAFPGPSVGLMSQLIRVLGKEKKLDETEAGKAISTAEAFLRSAKSILGVP